jgi:hypothetical protein
MRYNKLFTIIMETIIMDTINSKPIYGIYPVHRKDIILFIY